ncbi:MAG: hypothetical protein LBF81_03680, partial [Prevotellaceae bacterium]|nr:hypothetical protein [Prevotellaceae bacterium]
MKNFSMQSRILFKSLQEIYHNASAMERETTKKARALIRASYDNVIKAVNSDRGKIVLSDGVVIDAGKSLRKTDIYAIVSQDIG